MIFARVTNKNPCAICKSTNWCQVADRAVKCMRVESAYPCVQGGGWWHFFNEKNFFKPSHAPPPRRQEYLPTARLEELLDRWGRLTPPCETKRASMALALSETALKAVGMVYNASKSAWAFPMRDGEGRVIGISLRGAGGFKWTMQGTRNGLFYGRCLETTDWGKGMPFYVVEGATDTAALTELGLPAVGRHSCKGGVDQISVLLERLGIYRVVIVADNDDMKKLGQRNGRPGIEGAVELQKALHVRSVIYIPPSPFKDAREFVANGGTRAMIESDINNKVWMKGTNL